MLSVSELSQQFEDFLTNEFRFPAEPKGLYDPCNYLLAAGGKRLRPVLCLLAESLFTGAAPSRPAMHAALAVELFHNFTLMHDDIMDKAPLRRGKPTVHAEYGLAAGILSGDVMNIYAFKALEQIGAGHLAAGLQLFNDCAIAVCEGQQMDMDFEVLHEVTVDEYLKMIELKTAVLLASALKLGALIGDAAADEADRLYGFGLNLGIAFQLQDDYLDAFGTREQIGKLPGGDIRENKKSILMVDFQKNASDNETKMLEELQACAAEEKVAGVIRLYRQAGVDRHAKEMISSYTERAVADLSAIDAPDARKAPLHALLQQLLHRDH